MQEEQSPVKIFLKEAKNVSGESRIEQLLRKSLSEEQLAVSVYIERADEARTLGYDKVADVYEDLVNEEATHIGELQELLDQMGLAREEDLAHGAEEVNNIEKGY